MQKPSWKLLACTVCVIALTLSACSPKSEPTSQPVDDLQKAQAEATELVLHADATRIIMEAQARATALIMGAQQSSISTQPASVEATKVVAQVEDRSTPVTQKTLDDVIRTATPNPVSFKLLEVELAAEGNLIYINFIAPVREARGWQQGYMTVTEETSGTVYSEIPIAGTIGPLVARPKSDGQQGYVMLVNHPPYLKSGDMVTVILGDHKIEHVPVR